VATNNEITFTGVPVAAGRRFSLGSNW
jgi:hypothetical protein